MKRPVSLVLIFCSIFINSSFANEEFAPIVTLNQGGKIRGLVHKLEEDDNGTKVYFYQGIRYANAKRFSKPIPVTTWPEDIYDATKEGNACHQLVDGMDITKLHPVNQSEDCLFLNVWKPIKDNDDQKFPVMVWIHGGGFQTGTIFTPIYDGSALAAFGDVIVVSINYRLGMFGFLYGGNDDAPGNLGYYDQIMGLEWVRDNIESFGGNPNQVTIFGESAGGIAVSTMVLSPLTKSLFKRAIVQSGTAAPNVRIVNKENALDKTKKFAEKLNCPNNDLKKMMECLRSKPEQEIKKASKGSMKSFLSNEMIGPMMGDAVLPVDAMRFETFNQVDLMFGVTRDEGSMFIVHLVPELSKDDSKFTMEKVKETMVKLLNRYDIHDTEQIVNYYTRDLDASKLQKVRKMFSDFFGDFRFACPTMLFGEQLARRSNAKHHFYTYRFDRRSFVASMMKCTEWMGVCHGSEILYMFGHPKIKYFKPDFQISRDMIQAWTQFAKTGQPGKVGLIDWPEAFPGDPNAQIELLPKVMILDVKYKVMDNIYHKNCGQIWKEILLKEKSTMRKDNSKSHQEL